MFYVSMVLYVYFINKISCLKLFVVLGLIRSRTNWTNKINIDKKR